MNKKLEEKAKTFPDRPGVYLFRDRKGSVIYAGKARSLANRIRSYFSKGRDGRHQIEFLLKRTRAIEYIVTDTEKEALLLENTLIKRHKPRYNVDLRDDKNYTSIRIGTGHEFPAISLTRRIKKDGAAYFGPYHRAASAREAIEQIVRCFRLRTCNSREFANRIRPCLKYDMGRCTAPCTGYISKGDYAGQVEEAQLFLSGRSNLLIRRLGGQMKRASEEMRYEDAARLRNVIGMLKGVTERQKVVRHGGGDCDVIGIAREKDLTAICTLEVRQGALIGRQIYRIGEHGGEPDKVLEEFLLQHYSERSQIPPTIALSLHIDTAGAIADILAERGGADVGLISPKRGDIAKMARLAETNALEALADSERLLDETQTLKHLARELCIKAGLETIECVDISNLGGREAVGSIVRFVGGRPDKTGYRTYNIRTISKPDDYGMMTEVIRRRFDKEDSTRGRVIPEPGRPPPDLLLIDGGKGQLAITRRILDELGLALPVAAIAKGKKKGGPDHVFIPGRKNPLNFRKRSKELLLLMRIRDEAHRFCITAHRKRRIKASFDY